MYKNITSQRFAVSVLILLSMKYIKFSQKQGLISKQLFNDYLCCNNKGCYIHYNIHYFLK